MDCKCGEPMVSINHDTETLLTTLVCSLEIKKIPEDHEQIVLFDPDKEIFERH